MRNLNLNYQQRDEIIFGKCLVWEEDICGGYEHFEDLSLEQLAQLLEKNFAHPEEAHNYSPTIQEFYDFGKKSQALGFNPVFTGYVISPDRKDYRTSISGIDIKVDVEEIELEIDASLMWEFENFARKADDKIINYWRLYAWWD